MAMCVGYDVYGVDTLFASKMAPGSWDGATSTVVHGAPLPHVPWLPVVAVG